MNNFEKNLNNHLDELLNFARYKLNDKELAADAVQESLLKALKAQETIKDETSIRAWLFSILRNTITDLYRKQARNKQDYLTPDISYSADEIDTLACSCMEKLIPSLNKDYAFLIRELELKHTPTREIEKQLSLSNNALKVKRHRARMQLKQRLQETCRLCARHGCLDCDCS